MYLKGDGDLDCCYENLTAKEWYDIASDLEWELDIYKPLYLSLIVTLLSIGLWLVILNVPARRRKKLKELFEVQRQNSIMLHNLRALSEAQLHGKDNDAFSGTDEADSDIGNLRDVVSETSSVDENVGPRNPDFCLPEIVIELTSDVEDNPESKRGSAIFKISSDSDLSSIESEHEMNKKRRAEPDEKEFKPITIYD